MTRDSREPSDPEGPDGPPPEGTLHPTSPQVLTIWGLVGLVGGWLFHLYAVRTMTAPPLITWAQPLALVLVALILGWTARVTSRLVRAPGRRLEPHQAVNRLVLARARAYVGVLAAGGYLGYALSWVGSSAELADQRAVRSLVAGLAGLAVMAAALLLERACRVRKGEDDA